MIETAKAVFFDAGGTLFHPTPSVGEIYRRVAARYGCVAEADRIERIFRKVWIRRDGLAALESHSNEKVEKDWWRNLVRDVFSEVGGVPEFEPFFDELYDTFADPAVWRLYPETLEVIRELKGRKKRVGIVSNWDSRLFKLVEGLGLSGRIDFVLASAVFGASKPNPRIFEEALRITKVHPEEAVHVGDSLEDDIKGALKAGMRAILIHRDRQDEAERMRLFGDVQVIRNLKELLA